MSDVAQNLIALLRADTAVAKWAAARVREDHVPQATYDGTVTPAHIWLGLRQSTPFDHINGDVGESPMSVTFDLECIAGKQYDANQLAAAVRTKLHNYRGTFGDSTVKAIFINDQDNNYTPKATGGDNGLFVMAFDVQVIP